MKNMFFDLPEDSIVYGDEEVCRESTGISLRVAGKATPKCLIFVFTIMKLHKTNKSRK
jgi:hypothetical protein